MFSMGGGPGGLTGGPSSMASNAAAGLPAADVPGELRKKVEKVLEHEPEHTVPDVGWTVRASPSTLGSWTFLLGDHGGDPWHPDMGALFIAAGPSFVEGARVPPFENIEIYNLMAAALGIEPAPNSGDLARVGHLTLFG